MNISPSLSWPGLVLVIGIACGAIGCSDSPMAPSSTQLAGSWRLQSIRAAGQADQSTPSAATYTLTFADGRLSTQADCNVCTGGFTLSGRTVTAGPALACTRAACPTMAFENAYVSILAGESDASVSNETLLLSSSRGVLRFTR